MFSADAHCDTLTKYSDNPFFSEKSQWNLDKFRSVGGLLQYMAIFTPAELSDEDASEFAYRSIGDFFLHKPEEVVHLEKSDDFDKDKVNILLSLEGASPIINNLSHLHAFYKAGVRAITLTWNHENYVASGIDTDKGITDFGREAIAEMEKLGIIIDVSHLNDTGFEELAKIANRPFIASHSNAFAVRNHPRNLKDHQIRYLIENDGFIGINLYDTLLGPKDDDLKLKFVKHVDWMLNLGAQDILGMGADFDGIPSSPFENVTEYKQIYAILRDEMKLSEEQADKILYKNLIDYTLRML